MKLSIGPNLSLPIEAVTETFAILAKRGMGKTYTGAVLVEEMLRLNQQVVIADPIGVWWGLRSSSDGKENGFPVVVFGGEHADVPLEDTAGETVATAIIEGGFSAVLDFSLLRKGQQVQFMTAFAEALYRVNRKPLHFVVDEADAFAPQRPMPGEQRLLGAFEDIVRRGRARGLGVTLITQRAAVINKNVLTQIEVLVVLRTISPNDRAAIEAWIEIHGTEKQKHELMESLASLPVGMAWFWSPGWLDIFKKVAVRSRITFDSSATPKVGKVIIKPKQLAPVDLTRLGEQIKSTVERAKENDPKQLKRRIQELQRQVDEGNLKPAVIEKEKVPVLEPEQIAQLKQAAEDLVKVAEKIVEALKKWQFAQFTSPTLAQPQPWKGKGTISYKVSTGRPAAISRPESGEQTLGGGIRRILMALAQRPNLSARQIGVRAGLSSSSGSFGTYLARLRSLGYIEGDRNQMRITAAGETALGNYEPLPSGEELYRHWLGELGQSGASRILEVLYCHYPRALSKEEVGEKAGLSASSGSFGTYLSKLRTLELIEGRNELRASEELFTA